MVVDRTPGRIAEHKLPPDRRAPKHLAESVTGLHEAWNKAEADEGYDAKAAEWRARLLAPAAQSDGDGHAGD